MFYTYLLASGLNGTLYAGSTEDLITRVQFHKDKHFPGFTAKYGVDKLVWYELHPSRDQAFRRERQIKEWRRLWKIHLIERDNPNWLDLSLDLEQRLMDEEVQSVWQELPGGPAFAGVSGNWGDGIGSWRGRS
ncbi:MAG TPA: GIY-YIG nuclease family protein [Caulobacteraceae bacterium]